MSMLVAKLLIKSFAAFKVSKLSKTRDVLNAFKKATAQTLMGIAFDVFHH